MDHKKVIWFMTTSSLGSFVYSYMLRFPCYDPNTVQKEWKMCLTFYLLINLLKPEYFMLMITTGAKQSFRSQDSLSLWFCLMAVLRILYHFVSLFLSYYLFHTFGLSCSVYKWSLRNQIKVVINRKGKRFFNDFYKLFGPWDLWSFPLTAGTFIGG